jgi:hypothetical protein
MFPFCCERCYLFACLYYSMWLCAKAHTAAVLVFEVAPSSVLSLAPCAFYKDSVLCHQLTVTSFMHRTLLCLQAIDSRVEALVQARLQQTVQDLTTVRMLVLVVIAVLCRVDVCVRCCVYTGGGTVATAFGALT